MLNKIFLIGNLTRDPELTETSAGTQKCSFSLAVNRPVGSDGERKVDYFNCVAWRGLAETVARYSQKGNKLAVEGTVQIQQVEGNDGVKRTYVTVVAQGVEFLTPKASDSAPAPNQAPKEQSGQMDMFGSGRKPKLQAFDGDDGDIPF